MSKPSWSLLHAKKDQYVSADKTDIRATFARIRAEQAQQEALRKAGIVQIKRAAK